MGSLICAIIPVAIWLIGHNIQSVTGAKILVLHPLHGGSHKMQLKILSEHLIQRGHQVSTVSFLNVGSSVPTLQNSNMTDYVLTVDNRERRYPYMTGERQGRFRFPVELFWKNGDNPHYLPLNAFKMTEALCRGLFENTQLFTILRKQKFDLAVIDVISNECGLAYAYQLGLPVLAYWALFPVNGEMDFIGSFNPPSFVPSFLSALPEKMSFFERLYNTYLKLGGMIVMEYQFYLSNKYIQEFFPKTPHPRELIANLSGILVNSDSALDYAKILPPNVVNVGCMQCSENLPLPKDLQEFFLESSEYGVVIFSMGASFDASVAKSLLPKLFDAFSRLPQKVLMKSLSLPFVNVPPNVKIVPYFPQQSLLAHPQVKAFFTHAGLHSVFEAIWHGVPMVAMPVFGDQFDVTVRLREKGVAASLRKDASSETIYEALDSVINDPKIRENSKKLQKLLKDQKEHPMQRATWFIEYLLRNEGASHLKVGSRSLYWFQLYCFDVIFTMTLISLFLAWAMYKILIILYSGINKLMNALESLLRTLSLHVNINFNLNSIISFKKSSDPAPNNIDTNPNFIHKNVKLE